MSFPTKKENDARMIRYLLQHSETKQQLEEQSTNRTSQTIICLETNQGR